MSTEQLLCPYPDFHGFCEGAKCKMRVLHEAEIRSRARGTGFLRSFTFILPRLKVANPTPGAAKCVSVAGKDGGSPRLLRQAQGKRRRRLAQLPGQRGLRGNGRIRTKSRRRLLRARVTHCRYKPANQRPAQRISVASPRQCSSAPQSSAPQAPLHRHFNGSSGNETHLHHPFVHFPLSLASSTKYL